MSDAPRKWQKSRVLRKLKIKNECDQFLINISQNPPFITIHLLPLFI